MKKTNSNVACAGMDVHYKFSNVTFRDTSGRIVSRQWLDHRDRMQLQGRLSRWPVRFGRGDRSMSEPTTIAIMEP